MKLKADTFIKLSVYVIKNNRNFHKENYTTMKKTLKEIQQALMTGVSYMIPFVVAGGILMAISFLGGASTAEGFQVTNPFLQELNFVSHAAMGLMVPALAGYVAFGIAGRAAIAPGFIIGQIANTPVRDTEIAGGFIGALLMAILVGFFVKWVVSWKVPNVLRAIMPILVIPVLTVGLFGLLYVYVLSVPIVGLSDGLFNLLNSLSGANLIVFAVILGLICQIDMGGPITKTVTLFTLGLMAEGNYVANGIYRVAPSIPPLAILLSVYLFRNKWTDTDRQAANSAGVMGFMGITEGALPFLIKEPLTILPGTMIGCAVGAVIAALGGVQSPVPHGGYITAAVVTNPLWYIIAQVVGALVGALIIGALKKKPVEALDEETKESATSTENPDVVTTN